MSVVVAIKDKDTVWMACDSQVSCGYTKSTLSNPNNYKVCRPKEEKETLVGTVGDCKLGNIMKIQDRFIDELTYIKNGFDFKYMVGTIIPNIWNICKPYGLLHPDVNNKDVFYLNGVILFAHKTQIFSITSDGCCVEIDDYCATGSGSELALGYLNQSKDEDVKDRIIKAVKSACKTDLYVNYPIILTNTKDEEFIVIEKDI